MVSSHSNDNKRLGFVGLGSIGLPIALNLISAGFNLQIYSKSGAPKKNHNLINAKSFDSPKEAAKNTDFFLICVSDDLAVDMVLFGSEGAEKNLKKGSTVIDLSTISPSSARKFARRLDSKGIKYLDAPVTGGTENAKTGDLTIFLGGSALDAKGISSILNVIASDIHTFGEVGKGQEVKCLNQILVAGSYVALAEAITLGEHLDLPMNKVIDSLKKGAGSSWALNNRSQAMLENKFPLGFRLNLHHKDLSIVLKTAQECGLELSITSKVKELEEKLINRGYQDDDISVIKRYLD